MSKWLIMAGAALLAVGCGPQVTQVETAQNAEAAGAIQTAPAARVNFGPPSNSSQAGPAPVPRLTRLAAALSTVADAPDRGELASYAKNVNPRQRGAYTWHRTAVSEAHAINAIDGVLRFTTPDGQLLAFSYERHVEHPTGDWTWIGRVVGSQAGAAEAILTFGADAVFGSIAQPQGEPLRVSSRAGATWVVETDGKLAAQARAAMPGATDSDARIPDGFDKALVQQAASLATPRIMAATEGPTVDVLLGFTDGLAASLGGNSAAMTRMHYLVDVANQGLSNADVAMRVRLVHAMAVGYADAGSNDTALDELTGYDGTPVPSSLQVLRDAREQYGADLVSLVRKFDYEGHGGCGLGWVLGGGKNQIVQGYEAYAFTVVSDGEQQQGDYIYHCADETLAHELGHNLGSAHDRVTSMGDDGVLDDPADYGAYDYSFGYKTGAWHTIMAYGDSGSQGIRSFSTPRKTICLGAACGVEGQSDNARSLAQTGPIIAQFRATVVPSESSRPRYFDADGDGAADLLWRHGGNGSNTIWRGANIASQQRLTRITSLAWEIVGHGDFDGDGRSDVLWRNATTGANVVWNGGHYSEQTNLTRVSNLAWKVVGTGDFDGDGRDDIAWRNVANGQGTVWRAAQYADQQRMVTITNAAWKVVAVADLDGDGTDALIWRNNSTGANVAWEGADYGRQLTLNGVRNLQWKIAGSGDMRGVGRDDLVWRNTVTGANVIWAEGNGARQIAMGSVRDAAWQIVAIGDYDSDGVEDLAWRHATRGSNVIWWSASSADQTRLGNVTDNAWQVYD